ncbi:MAG TPA: GGDEF domain-containing protein [Candidatus Limnocylindrales bacterium]|nr:GGDEF domain-containing protein [Candidatus Limnocylindrales bacterium]
MTRPPLVDRRPTPPALAAFTAATILGGVAALAWATANLRLGEAIALDGIALPFRDQRVAGLAFWTVLGLIGSARTRSLGGRGVITFHLPFIVAAMTLGGPVAGAWVGAISSLELRELREVPWFGTLANHSIVALGAVAGGLVAAFLEPALEPVLYTTAATLVASVAGALVFCAVDVGMSTLTIGLRERLPWDELVAVVDTSGRQTLAGEMVLGWLLAAVYQSIGWWAPIACAVVVLIIWEANDEHDRSTHDELTGLLNRRGFNDRVEPILRRAKAGQAKAALVMVDLDGFKAVNDTLGHAAGDDVLRQTGKRLRSAIRYTDVAARFGGDEFVLVLGGVPDRAAAQRIVKRVHSRVIEPIALAGRKVVVGASMGLTFLDEETASNVLESADEAMYAAKKKGGGVLAAT